jgi:hypothetical protein
MQSAPKAIKGRGIKSLKKKAAGVKQLKKDVGASHDKPHRVGSMRWLGRMGVDVDRVAADFGMSKGKLAETVGVRPDTLQRSSRSTAPKTQTRLREMLEIITRISEWAGGDAQALAWYRAEPIPAFGGRTAESLVKDGKAGAVRDYLDHVAVGGFA